jgi:hypothetical protein
VPDTCQIGRPGVSRHPWRFAIERLRRVDQPRRPQAVALEPHRPATRQPPTHGRADRNAAGLPRRVARRRGVARRRMTPAGRRRHVVQISPDVATQTGNCEGGLAAAVATALLRRQRQHPAVAGVGDVERLPAESTATPRPCRRDRSARSSDSVRTASRPRPNGKHRTVVVRSKRATVTRVPSPRTRAYRGTGNLRVLQAPLGAQADAMEPGKRPINLDAPT